MLIRISGCTVLGFASICCAAFQTMNADSRQRSRPLSTGSLADKQPVEVVPLPQRLARPITLGFGLDPIGDIKGGSGHAGNGWELLHIAIYASVGNRDAVEISSNRLRKFGLTREAMQDAIDRVPRDVNAPDGPLRSPP